LLQIIKEQNQYNENIRLESEEKEKEVESEISTVVSSFVCML
jgi:hypothetical protein